MTTTDVNADTSASPNRTGVYLAVLQLVFTLGWPPMSSICRNSQRRSGSHQAP
jgi:hypothetical protein